MHITKDHTHSKRRLPAELVKSKLELVKSKLELVKSKFLKLNQMHIEFVLDCMKNNTTEIRNIKKYLLAVLFNAPSTMDSYYTSLVAHDMASGKLYGGGGKK